MYILCMQQLFNFATKRPPCLQATSPISGALVSDSDLPASGQQVQMYETTKALASDNDLPGSGLQVKMFLTIRALTSDY